MVTPPKSVKMTSGSHSGNQFIYSLTPANESVLDKTLFSVNSEVNRFVTISAKEHYGNMMAGSRQCHMSVTVFSPMTKERADHLNSTRTKIAYSIAGAAGAAAGPLGYEAGFIAGYAARTIALGDMRTYHSGDLVIGIDASVSGGIDPQRSTRGYVMSRSQYDFDYSL